jgi:uncharacterized protein YlxP (DUF503 family)
MTIGVVTIRMRLPSRTLKEKRAIVKSVVERLQTRYNAAVIETDDLDIADLGSIAAVVVSNEARHADEQAQSIVTTVTNWRLDAEIYEVGVELIDV